MAKKYNISFRMNKKAEKLYYGNSYVMETFNKFFELYEAGQWNDAINLATGLWRGENAVFNNSMDFVRFFSDMTIEQNELSETKRVSSIMCGNTFKKIAYQVAELEYAMFGDIKDAEKVLDFITKPSSSKNDKNN